MHLHLNKTQYKDFQEFLKTKLRNSRTLNDLGSFNEFPGLENETKKF